MEKFKVLATRRIPEVGLDILEPRCELDVFEGEAPIPRDTLLTRVRGKDGMLCLLSDTIDREVIDLAGGRLSVISNYAVGCNNIDVEYATGKGILVTNTPGVLTEATADLTWALLLACARRIPESDRSGRFFGWGPTLMLGFETSGKKIGIVGMGEIGKAVARRARGFGMRIVYHNRKRDLEGERDLGAVYVPMEELLRTSDFVTLHVPLTPETRGLIGRKELGMMKPTAVFLNAARGEIVDEQALVEALREGRIAAAGLDVYQNEPRLSTGLAELENVVLTPHTGSATHEARNKMAIIAAENLVAALTGKRPRNLVNPIAWKG